MYTKTFLSAIALATAVSANNVIEERQLADLPPKCSKALNQLLPIIQDIPTPPPVLATASLDPCASPTFTGSASEAYVSYTKEAQSWALENQSALESGLAECPQLTKFAGGAGVPVCTDMTMSGGSSMTMPTGSSTMSSSPSGATPTPTGGDSGSGSGSGSGDDSTPPNAAPRVGGMAGVAAAIVAMGVAIAAL